MPKGYSDLPQCTGHTRSGKRCKRTAKPPTDKCYRHGGNSLSGIAHPNYKDGKRSRRLNALPETLRGAFQGNLDNPKLKSLDEDIALADTRIEELLKRIPGNDGGNLWQKAQGAFQQFKRASQNRDLPNERRAELMATQLDALESALQKGYADYALWGEVFALIDKRRALVEAGARIEFNRQTVLSAQEASLFAQYIVRASLSAIDNMDTSDKIKRRAKQDIQDDLARIVSSMNKPLPPVIENE